MDKNKIKSEVAILGAGCFWGVEKAFQGLKGVESIEVGFSGGHTENPSYEQVCKGVTGHAEVVKIEFDPKEISFLQILDVFWSIHDPTQINRQGLDVGAQYRSVIFYVSEKQKKLAEESRGKRELSGKYNSPITTSIEKFSKFYRAEEYHQHYFDKMQKGIYV